MKTKLENAIKALELVRGETFLLKKAVDYRDDSLEVLLRVGDIDTRVSHALSDLKEVAEGLESEELVEKLSTKIQNILNAQQRFFCGGMKLEDYLKATGQTYNNTDEVYISISMDNKHEASILAKATIKTIRGEE